MVVLKKLSIPQAETATYRINRYIREDRGASMGVVNSFECKVCQTESFNGSDVKHTFCVICDFSHDIETISDEWISHLEKMGLIKRAENYKKVLDLRKEWAKTP